MSLSTALAKAQTLLETHPRGILPLPTRRRVWSALIVPGDDPVSCRRLWALKAACVEHSLSFWYRAFPDDNRITGYLALAREVETGRADGNEADLAATRFWQHLPAIDVEARRGFWRWYLTQAGPQVAAIDVVG